MSSERLANINAYLADAAKGIGEKTPKPISKSSTPIKIQPPMAKPKPMAAVTPRYAFTIKYSPALIVGLSTTLLTAFASMVAAAYTADHIRHSGIDLSKNESLHTAYTWAKVSAICGGVASGLMILGFIALIRREKK